MRILSRLNTSENWNSQKFPSLVMILYLGALLISASGFAEQKQAKPELVIPVFVDVTPASGVDFQHISGDSVVKNYLFEGKGGGVAVFDFDGDGWLDLYFPQGSTLEMTKEKRSPHGALFRNRGDWNFEEVTESARLTSPGWGMGAAAADVNNDGFVDLYVTNLGPNYLYLNNGDGSFREVAQEKGVDQDGWSTSAAFGDYDEDGRLDLFVARYLAMGPGNLPSDDRRCQYLGHKVMCGPNGYEGATDSLFQQQPNGSFREMGASTGVSDPEKRYGLGCVWGDVDDDGDLDLYVANDTHPNSLFVNQGDGSFQERGLVTGLSLNADGRMQAGMGIDLADYDNDGQLDAYSTHWVSDYSTLYHNRGDLVFEDVTAQAQIAADEYLLVSWGTGFVDLNNDGWRDIFHANGHVYPFIKDGVDVKKKGMRRRASEGAENWRDRGTETYAQQHSIYLNLGDGTFANVSGKAGPGSQVRSVGRGTAYADFDNDGDMDVVVANMNGRPLLLRNDQASSYHWVSFRTVGAKSNRDGIGARILITAGDLKQVHEIKRNFSIYSSSDPRAHFGLGDAKRVDHVQVRWPSGTVQEFRNIAGNVHYLIHETKGLSRIPAQTPKVESSSTITD